MPAIDEIDYGALLDRSIKDFQPAKMLWPVDARLACWAALEGLIVALALWLRRPADLTGLVHNPRQVAAALLFMLGGIVAAALALKSAIPGRKVSWAQLLAAIAAIGLACVFGGLHSANQIVEAPSALVAQQFRLSALPWFWLFWAVRRGVPLRPELSGGLIGAAAFSFSAGLYPIINGSAGGQEWGLLLGFSCTMAIVLSATAGHYGLNRIARWQLEETVAEVSRRYWIGLGRGLLLPVAVSAATAALIIFVLNSPGLLVQNVPEFDLVMKSYQRAAVDFRPNVPSGSMETMLTAYIEHGMPAYMWDFSPEGFKLVGGRWEPSFDGTPMTYTWFRGAKNGIICIFRQTDTFSPPSIAHEEHHHLLFYKYRGFSFCLINVGGYGNFVSVIAAPIPLKQFEHLVLAATL